jgi:hypothetical protein
MSRNLRLPLTCCMISKTNPINGPFRVIIRLPCERRLRIISDGICGWPTSHENLKTDAAEKKQVGVQLSVHEIANVGCEGVVTAKRRQWWLCRLGYQIRTYSNSQLTFAVKLLSPDNSEPTSFGLRGSASVPDRWTRIRDQFPFLINMCTTS